MFPSLAPVLPALRAILYLLQLPEHLFVVCFNLVYVPFLLSSFLCVRLHDLFFRSLSFVLVVVDAVDFLLLDVVSFLPFSLDYSPAPTLAFLVRVDVLINLFASTFVHRLF